jgi:hypothetical protein
MRSPGPSRTSSPRSNEQRPPSSRSHARGATGPTASRAVRESWTETADGVDLRKRIGALPGFGEMKIKALGAVLAKRFDVAVAQDLVPNHPTLGDVDSLEALEAYQEKKRAYKAKQQA